VTGALTGRFVEGGAEGLARLRGDGHAVVGLEDETAGSLLAVMLHVVAVDEGKGAEDVVDVIALDAVEVEERTIEFGPQHHPAVLIPSEGRTVSPRPRARRSMTQAVPSSRPGEGLEVVELDGRRT